MAITEQYLNFSVVFERLFINGILCSQQIVSSLLPEQYCSMWYREIAHQNCTQYFLTHWKLFAQFRLAKEKPELKVCRLCGANGKENINFQNNIQYSTLIALLSMVFKLNTQEMKRMVIWKLLKGISLVFVSTGLTGAAILALMPPKPVIYIGQAYNLTNISNEHRYNLFNIFSAISWKLNYNPNPFL